jgi:transcriptional regulator with XRE-family HTH domain
MSATTQDRKILPSNIRFLRKKAKLSQEELAANLDISRSNVAAYESKGVEPRLRIVLEMARFFDVSVRAFVAQDLATLDGQIPSFDQDSLVSPQAHIIDLSDNDAMQKLMDKTVQIRKVVEGFKAYQEIKFKRNAQGASAQMPYGSGSFLELLDQLVSHNEAIISSVSSVDPA